MLELQFQLGQLVLLVVEEVVVEEVAAFDFDHWTTLVTVVG